MKHKSLLTLVLAIAAFSSYAADRLVFEGEDGRGGLVAEDARASKGKLKTDLGREKELEFPSVEVAQAGRYVLTLETFDNQNRKVYLSVNGSKGEERNVSPGYDNTCGVATWEIELAEGKNAIKFFNAGGKMPAIDRFMLSKYLDATDAPGSFSAPFGEGWRFRWGAVKGGDARKIAFDDSAWKIVDLPHDAQFEQPWTRDGTSGARGFKPMGEMWYRKLFTLSTLGVPVAGKRLSLEFGGMLCVGDVYVNGVKVASTEYGYLPVVADITDVVREDAENVVAVWCSTGKKEGSRWYTGAGLFRDAKIVSRPLISIARNGIFVKSFVEGADARVEATVELAGFEKKGRQRNLEVSMSILDAAGVEVASLCSRAPWSKKHHQEVALGPATIKNVRLWDVDSPNLYTARVRLVLDGKEIDCQDVRFGARKIELDYDWGLKLNGRKLFVKSMSGHHDLGAVGAAAYRRAIKRQFELMKDFGYNAIRCSHNPYSEDFYDLADEMGLLVMDELIDKWTDSSYWFGRKPFTAIWPSLVTEWMKRDRNHPSIFAWSFGNELQMRDDLCGYAGVEDWGVTMYRVIKAFSRRWDETRPTTVAMFPSREGAVYKNDPGFMDDPHAPEMALETDFASLNYQWNCYKDYVRNAPRLNIFQSEAVVAERQAPYLGMDFDHSIGCSYWGAIEYWGESNKWPKKGWNYAFFSHTLEPYPLAYLIKSVMTDEPLVRLAVSVGKDEKIEWNDVAVGNSNQASVWDREVGATKDGKVKVFAYTNCDEVELFLNGESVAKAKNDVPSPHTDKPSNTIEFVIPYREGELKALAFRGGKVAAEHAIETSGEAVRLEAVAEEGEYKADGEDLIYVRCRAVDEKGRAVRNWRGKVSFSCTGEARFLCCDNGDHSTDELFTSDITAKSARNGFILAIFRTTKSAGEVKILANSEELGQAEISLATK